MKFNIIAVSLNKYSTIEEYKKLGADNNIDLLPEAMLEMRTKFSKAFIDVEKNIVVAVVRKDGTFALTEDMEKTLSTIQPLSPKNVPAMNLDFKLDDILDKINESGINSLTHREKLFLKRISDN
mgnify:CR=1 FL=1